MVTTPESLGGLIRAYRQRAQLSQERLADRAGVSVRTLRDIEGGRVREPRATTLQLLAEALALDEPARATLVAAGPLATRPLAQVPAAVPDFTGRGALVAELIDRLASPLGSDPGARVVVLGGPAGVGKTALAVHLAHRLWPEFPGGQLFAELRGDSARPAAPAEVLGAFLHSLGVSDGSTLRGLSERAASFRSHLFRRRMLILLDGAHDAAQIRPLIPGGSDSAVLVTARGRLADLEGAHFVTLAVLDEEEAGVLFSRVAKSQQVDRDRSATRRVLAACGGLPLALRIAGARVAAWPDRGLAQLADRLAEEQERLSQLTVGDLEVRAGLASSYRGLSTEAQRAFRLMGTMDLPDVPHWAWSALLDREDEAGVVLLNQLVDVHLAEVTTTAGQLPRIRMHDLVRLYARERVYEEDPAEVAPAVGRAAGAWLSLADEAEPGLRGGFTRTLAGPAPRRLVPAAAIAYAREHPNAWFEAEREALGGLVRRCVDQQLDDQAWDLAGVTARFFELRGHYADFAATVELGLHAARRSGHVRAEAFLLRAQGELAADLDQYDLASDHLERALALSRETYDEVNEAWTLRALSTVSRVQGRGDAAEECLINAIAIFERVADTTGMGECHYGLGAIAREHGRLEDANHHYAVALAIFRALDDPFNESLVLMSAARLYQVLGNTTQAAENLEQALALCRAIDHPGGVAWASTYLGDLRLADDHPDTAEPLLTEAVTLARRLGDRYCEAVTMHTLGRLRLASGDQEAADVLLRSSVDLADACDLSLHKGRSLITLGDSQLLRGAVAAALKSWQSARDLLSTHGFPEAEDAEARLLAREDYLPVNCR